MKITMSEYAKRRGVSKAAVHKAVKAGRIKIYDDGAGKRYLNLEEADADWARNTGTTANPSGLSGAIETQAPPKVQPQPPSASPRATATSDDKKIPSITDSRAIKEAFLARSAKLDYDERSGTLVKADEIRKEYFGLMRALRDHLLNIPDRIAAELAAESNQFVVHKKLSEELRKALQSMKGYNG